MLDPEIRVLAARSALLPRGLALLHRGSIEYVATALGAQPALVERARACLQCPAEREMLLHEFADARRARPAPPRPPADDAGAPVDPPHLAAAAERHPLGVAFLLRAPIETAAIAFGVHPELVLAARALVAPGAAGLTSADG